MGPLLRRLRRDEDGAVTVDWLVLTAAVCGLALGVVGIVRVGALDPAEGLGARLTSIDVASRP